MNLGRAQNLSLLLLFSGVYILLQGMNRRRAIILFLISFFYVWSYGGFVLILAVAGAFGLVEFVVRWWVWGLSPPSLKLRRARGIFPNHFFHSFSPLFVSLLGVIAGLVVNPYFPKSLSFLKIQMFQIPFTASQVKKGMEWNSILLHFQEFVLDNLSVLVLFAVSVGVFIYVILNGAKRSEEFRGILGSLEEERMVVKERDPSLRFVTLRMMSNWDAKIKVFQFLFLSLFFFALTLRSQRFIEYFIPFTVLFIAYVLGSYMPNFSSLKEDIHKNLLSLREVKNWLNVFVIGCFFLVTSTFVVVNISLTLWYFSAGWPQDEYKNAANWLKQNTPKQSTIFNMDWDNFPELFYYNTDNYYIVGMDPTFMYEYDSKLYWMWYHITVRWNVCDEEKCSGKEFPPPAEVVKNTFHSDYIFIKKTHRMNQNLERELQKVFDDGKAVIYKL